MVQDQINTIQQQQMEIERLKNELLVSTPFLYSIVVQAIDSTVFGFIEYGCSFCLRDE